MSMAAVTGRPSSNKKIATVKNGVVTIKKKGGTATITAMATDGSGIYASCDVNVGFSGTTITIGSYVRRVGTYTWSVGNFSRNGVKPAEESPEVLLESYEFETKDSEVNREGKIFFRGILWGIPYGIASKIGYLESYESRASVNSVDSSAAFLKITL